MTSLDDVSTLEEVMEKLQKHFTFFHEKYVIRFIVLVAALTGFLFGFDTGVISGAILFISNSFHLSNLQNGMVVSSVLLGAFIGAVLSGKLADLLGRRQLLLITAVIFALGAFGSSVAHTLLFLIVSRIVVGLAVGISSFVAPLYVAEISPTLYRGTFVGLNQLFVSIGVLAAFIIDYFLAGSASWRLMFEMGIIPAALLFWGVLFIPESPRWLVMRGRGQQAWQVLSAIRFGSNIKAIEWEYGAIKSSLIDLRNDWKMLFRPWILPALTIGFGLAVFKQIVGINTVMYYAPTLFEIFGFERASSAILANIAIWSVTIIFIIIALKLVDRWGRRPLLLIGIAGMAVSLIVLSWSYNFLSTDAKLLKWIALWSMMIYIPCFAISLGTFAFLIICEIYPLRLRALAASLAIALNWALNVVVALTFMSVLSALTPSGMFWIYSAICILAWFFVYFMVPETKKISLEQIEANLRAGKRGRELGEAS